MSVHPMVPLGEVCAINPRVRRADLPPLDTAVSFVPMAAVDETTGTIVQREERALQDVVTGYTSFEEGDVLFAKITPCMQNGKSAVASELLNGVGRGSTEFYVLRPGDRVLADYVHHFVRQKTFREIAERNFTGTAGQQRVPKSFMEQVEIPLPPLDEQWRIVDILNRAASIERLRAEAREKLRAFIPALFIRMFGDQREIARRYECKPLKEVASIGSGATKGRKINPHEAVEVPYLRVANVQDGFLNLDEIKRITIKAGEEDKYALKPGDLVMTEGGDPDKLGRAAIWEGQLTYCAHQNHVFRVRADEAEVLGQYLRAVAGSAYGKAYFLSVAKQTTGIASINKTQLGNLPVPVPPRELQARFVEIVNNAQAIGTTAETASATAAALSASLMARLFGDTGADTPDLQDDRVEEVQ